MELLLVYFVLGSSLDVNRGIEISRSGDYEKSEKILENINVKSLQNRDTYTFYRFYNHFMMNHKKQAQKYLGQLESGFDLNLPERYKVLTSLMKSEIELWADEEDLSDVARDMRHIGDRLQTSNAGKKTQKIQQDVITKLDKMIKEKEDQLNQKNQANSQDSGNQNQKALPKPLDESQIAKEGGKGIVNQPRIKNLAGRWGSLPPRDRQSALQEITQGLSARHREAVENYFKNLAGPTKR